MGIGSVNDVARATSSYSSSRDEQTARMQTQMDSLEDLLDVMAMGNPTLQAALAARRAHLGMAPRANEEPAASTQPGENNSNYFDDINLP